MCVCVREVVLCVGTCCVADQAALHAVITPEARVLMISPLWKNGHSVHRNFKDAVTALQGAFDVRDTSPITHTHTHGVPLTSLCLVVATGRSPCWLLRLASCLAPLSTQKAAHRLLWCVNGPALLVCQALLLVVCLTAHIHCMWHNTTQPTGAWHIQQRLC